MTMTCEYCGCSGIECAGCAAPITRAEVVAESPAVELLRRLVAGGYKTDVAGWHENWTVCFFCGVDSMDTDKWEDSHAEDCLFFAAKAFLASLEEPTDG